MSAPAPKQKQPCPDCAKQYSNLRLHIVKAHKKAYCMGCDEWKPIDTMVFELADKKQGKKCDAGLCEECFT